MYVVNCSKVYVGTEPGGGTAPGCGTTVAGGSIFFFDEEAAAASESSSVLFRLLPFFPGSLNLLPDLVVLSESFSMRGQRSRMGSTRLGRKNVPSE